MKTLIIQYKGSWTDTWTVSPEERDEIIELARKSNSTINGDNIVVPREHMEGVLLGIYEIKGGVFKNMPMMS